MEDAVTSGSSYECEYMLDGITSNAWIKGNSFRIETSSNGKVIEAIGDGSDIYTWNSGSSVGRKYSITDLESLPAGFGKVKYKHIRDVAAAAKGDCKKKKLDNELFSPPPEVDFQDISDVLRQIREPSPQMVEHVDPCAHCTTLTDPQTMHDCLSTCQPH